MHKTAFSALRASGKIEYLLFCYHIIGRQYNDLLYIYFYKFMDNDHGSVFE